MVLPKPRANKPTLPPPPEDLHAAVYYKPNGRAYGDFRAWSAWGGKQEALIEPGERFATRSSVTATILLGGRLEVLRSLRTRYPDGLPPKVMAYLAKNYPKGISARELAGLDLDALVEQCEDCSDESAETTDDAVDPLE